MLDVLATGYPSFDSIFPVSHSPKVGETALIQAPPDEANGLFGGCGANVAVGLSRLGLKAGVAMILGDDTLGASYQAYLRQQNVNQANVICTPGMKTSRSYLFRSPDGEYQNFFYAGAADEWRGELRLDALAGLKYGLITVGPFYYNQQFVKQMAAANIPVVWQMKPDVQAYPVDSVALFLESSEIILMNHIEAEFVRAAAGVQAVRDLLRGKTQVILVTQGAAGVTVHTKNTQTTTVPIVTQVKDTTGAGDGFTAGFLAGVLKGYDVEIAARMGLIVASFVLEAIGCQTNLPDWYQMQTRYEEQFGSL